MGKGGRARGRKSGAGLRVGKRVGKGKLLGMRKRGMVKGGEKVEG